MSQHHLKISIKGQDYELVMGYDRPTSDVFFFIEGEKEVLYSSDYGHTVAAGLNELGFDSSKAEAFESHLEPVIAAIELEQLAHDEHSQIAYFSQALIEGRSREEIAKKLEIASSFNDFNRIVTYPAFAA